MTTNAVRYVASGDVQIAYTVAGDGPVDLLLVPGFIAHQEVILEEPGLRKMFGKILTFAREISFDRRGMGLSDRGGAISTLENTVDDMRAVLDAVGSKRAAVLATSEGGPASILFAATYPHRMQSLILWGSYPRILQAPDYPTGVTPEQLARAIDRIVDQWGGPAAIEIFAPTKAADPEFCEWWARMLRMGASPNGVRNLMSLYYELDVRHVLPAVRCPTLILHNEGDRVSPVECARYMAAHIPGARLVEFPGRDHLMWTEDPDAVLGEIEEFLTGKRATETADRILATVLFTDIVGSTSLAQEHGDARWRELLARHDAVTRRALERYRGREVKTTGDGFLAAFDGPARAISCARAIDEGVRALGLEVRAGVHTGECEVREGGDLTGIAVHIARRVCDRAVAGEVLASSTVRDLVAGSGIVFDDRGRVELKGISGEWRLFAVTN